ncbi:unnamed protein product [Mesocestoides corti]|uniref:FABD domain-containing protein n=1 Tax=Mesocestoides corti TaxID=53468 RepID=A0A0R3UNI7_MESCO|nr:unnamed protein product [Mesocestoides corti]
MHNSFDINAAVEHELQRDRIRMPPPPPPPPFFAHQRSSSCERVDDNSLVASAEVFRRGHAESFTSRDASVGSHCPPYNYHQQHHLQQGFASPSRGRMVPGNRFSEVFPASCMPPHQEVGSAGEPQDVHTAGSLGRKKAAPAPPMRTTTLRPEEQSEMLPTGLQVFTGDLHGCSRVVDDHLPSPPDVVCGNLHPHPGVHQLPQSSPPCVPEGHSLMTSSATFTTSPLTGAIRRAVLPVPPQRSESTRSQKSVNDFASQVSSHQPSKASPLKTHLTHSPPNGLATNPDFQNELSSRLKRQLEGSKSAVASNRSPGVSTLPKLKQPADGALTAEMIQASKSKLKTTSTPVVSEPQSPPLAPSVPAWKELVVQRRLKNAEAPVGKRMSWTPTSNTSAGSFKAQQPPSVESFPEEEDEDLPPIMSQSVTYGNGNEGAPTTGPLSYENLLKQVTSLCADLNLAKVNLPNEHNSALVDRIEGLKHACLSYVDEADCSAHSKFRFRDECARLQTAADALRAVCSVGGKPSSSSDCGGRRKTFQAACNTVEAIHQTLLRLPPSASAVPEAADDSCMSAGAV